MLFIPIKKSNLLFLVQILSEMSFLTNVLADLFFPGVSTLTKMKEKWMWKNKNRLNILHFIFPLTTEEMNSRLYFFEKTIEQCSEPKVRIRYRFISSETVLIAPKIQAREKEKWINWSMLNRSKIICFNKCSRCRIN